jgi:hypothetical protein
MSRRRYEILLPIRYNDRTPIEPEKFFLTQEELVARFGALTTCPELLRGVWTHGEQRFEDENLRLIVDVEASQENRDWFLSFKEKLKSRFRQLDVWIVSYEIDVV